MNRPSQQSEKLSSGKYILVLISLVCLTALTVGLSYSKRTLEAAVAGAMTIAMIKGFLVGGYFMHLLREKPVIFWLLVLTFILFVFLLALPVIGLLNGVKSNAGLFS